MKEILRLKKNQNGIETFIKLIDDGLTVEEVKDSKVLQIFLDGTKELENGFYLMEDNVKIAKLSEKLKDYLISKNVIEIA